MANGNPCLYDSSLCFGGSVEAMTDSRFLASSLFALSLFAVPGVDLPNVAIEGLSLASGAELKAGACNRVHVFVQAAPTFQGSARIQLVLREAGGELVFSGTRTVVFAPGEKDTVVFESIPVRASGRHVLSASALAGDSAEMQAGLDVSGMCVA